VLTKYSQYSICLNVPFSETVFVIIIFLIIQNTVNLNLDLSGANICEYLTISQSYILKDKVH
jgi:hypothetical protein